MDKQELTRIIEDYVENAADNVIAADIAISEKVVGLKMYERPIIGFGAADDECFQLLKQPGVIGAHFMFPGEWLPTAKTVISIFLPFSEAVRSTNQVHRAWPSEEWLHARIEGQKFINSLCRKVQAILEEAGYASLVPGLDARFWNNTDKPHPNGNFTSNWSERHVAFVCGLGTFGLSRGLITAQGMAGRFGSVITTLNLPPDIRGYKDYDEYCSHCGKCVERCPVKAISEEEGKDHLICSRFIDHTMKKYTPRYGCGKCQVGVPCEFRIPLPDDSIEA